MNARIESPESLVAWRRESCGNGPVSVVTGTFDLFQPGNLFAIRKAVSLGFPVVVVVEPDDMAAAHCRPGHPQNRLETRIEMVSHLRGVAAVTSVTPGQAGDFFGGLGEFIRVTVETPRAEGPYSRILAGRAARVVSIEPVAGCFTEDVLHAMEQHKTPVTLPAGWDGAPAPEPSVTKGAGARVTVNGCFDILHVGHLRFLEEARTMGDSLTVLINSDASVARYKGVTRPVFPERFRTAALRALRSVDEVVVFQGDNPLAELQGLRPAIHVKGGSYEPDRVRQEQELVESWGGKLVCTPMVDGFSTTNFIKKALKSKIRKS